MTLALLMVCEAEADFRTGSGFVDRLLCERVDWIDAETLDDYRRWRGADDSRPFLTWTDAAGRARQTGEIRTRARGYFDGQPGEAYAFSARRALLLLQALAVPLDGVVLLIDDDGDVDRLEGLKQAREASPLTCPV